MNDWDNFIFSSVQEFGHKFMNAIPNILGALVILLVGWALAKGLSYIIRKILASRQFQQLFDRLHILSWVRQNNVDVASILSRFVYWVIMLFFFIAASETLEWTAVSNTLSHLLSYLPALFSAVVIAVIGLYIAQLIRDFINTALRALEVGAAKLISTFAFYVIALIVILTALDQAGIDTTLVTSNLTLIIGAVMLAFAVSFALASKDILRNMLSAFYSRENFRVGDHIRIGEVEGHIVRIDRLTFTVRTDTTEVTLPAERLISEQIEKLL